MKKLILNNWQIKLVCLALAIAMWFAIKQMISRPGGDRRPAASWNTDRS